MTPEDWAEFEPSWRAVKYKKKDKELDITYYLVNREDEQPNLPIVKMTELYAESIWGRSYTGLGTIHEVDISQLEEALIEALTPEEFERLYR